MEQSSIRRERLVLVFSLLFLLCAILFSGARSWLLRVSAPVSRPHPILRLAPPGLDIGADAWPARPGAAGYVEVWMWSHIGDDIQMLLQISTSYHGESGEIASGGRRDQLVLIITQLCRSRRRWWRSQCPYIEATSELDQQCYRISPLRSASECGRSRMQLRIAPNQTATWGCRWKRYG